MKAKRKVELDSRIVSYVNTPQAIPSGTYGISVNGRELFVQKLFSVHFVRFAAAGGARIEVTAREKIRKYTVLPARQEVAARQDGDRLVISVSKPRHLFVTINDHENLLVLIDPLEESAPGPHDVGVVDVMAFVTDNAGKIEQTAAIHQAIEHAASTPGKNVIYFPAGVYLTDTIKIFGKKGLTLYLAEGAMLKMTLEPGAAWPAGIFIRDSSDITVSGRGVYNHMAREFFELCDYKSYGEIQICPVLVVGSRNITLMDITIVNGRCWNMGFHNSDYVKVINCKVITPPESCPEWTDGINFSACRHVLIDGTMVYCNDDCFASGHYFEALANRELDDLVMRNCLGYTPRANAIRIGWDTRWPLMRYTFERCDFIGGGSHCYALTVHRLKEGKRYQKIVVRDCTFSMTEKMHGAFSVDGDVEELVLEDLTIDTMKPSKIIGVKKLTIQGLKQAGKARRSADEAQITLTDVGQASIS